ncbi:hypothetical protein AUN14_07770 [Cronobacter muytjensii]|uniref:Uncharacterized protein n=1 Tax=Cronobacter muytjensii TaxID=413501 RepID=A0A2T7AUC3_9ENTR|nr:hypothetical protein AUN14_07770 [Cronobacter muytjensii]
MPCQWRRIIGSNQNLTRGNLKKVSKRVFFHHLSRKTAIQPVICRFLHQIGPCSGILLALYS